MLLTSPTLRPRSAALLALSVLMLFLVFAGGNRARAQSTYYDRNEIPGHYTIGLYGDEKGTVGEIALPEGEQVFECFVGISGDSTRVFSALVFRLDLPTGVQLDGPITWAPVPGLKQLDSVTGKGAQVEFNQECLAQAGDRPAIVARMRVRVSPEVDEFELEPLAHRDYGLSVELCDGPQGWPKPFAEPVSLTVHRKKGFWSRVQSWFGG